MSRACQINRVGLQILRGKSSCKLYQDCLGEEVEVDRAGLKDYGEKMSRGSKASEWEIMA